MSKFMVLLVPVKALKLQRVSPVPTSRFLEGKQFVMKLSGLKEVSGLQENNTKSLMETV